MDLLGRRWALRILWELRTEATGPRALLDRIEGLSSSVLYDRLRELGEAGLVEQSPDGYRLTATGRLLGDAIAPLSAWADHWAAVLRDR
jgi:DNA-binding HxlR family transcriptional regulator